MKKRLRSCCGEVVLRGTAEQLQKKYEGMGYEAERSKQDSEAHMFWQYAEHYKKEDR